MRYYLKADHFFTEDERRRIKETTQRVESRTIGEVAVMVVDSSDRYREAEVIGGIILGSLLSLIMTIVHFHSSIWVYVPLSFLLFFPAWFVFNKFPVFKTASIGLKRKEHAVRERAIRAFYEKGLYRTKKNTGVLFFLSLLEHKVWVLADRGIYEKIDQETLNKFAKSVSQGVKEGRACDALCDAMKDIGELLARHFPMTPGDIDELTDELIME